jgi:signal peptidase I
VEPLSNKPSDDGERFDAPDGTDSATAVETEETPAGTGRGIGRTAVEWVGLVVLALVIALLIKTFLFQAFYIPSESMVPTLKVHDRVLVNKLSYKLHPVHRGDIIVFKAPPHADPGIDDLVKRVIGLPGDSVSGRGGHVYINNKLLAENYLPAGTFTSDFEARVIPKDSYWVMGDNRGNSKDSRSFGFITKKQIVGRVFLRIWPLNRLGIM